MPSNSRAVIAGCSAPSSGTRGILIRPIGVSKELVKFSVPVMIVASIAMLVMGLDGTLSRAEGILLLAAALLYSVYCIVQSRRASASVSEGDVLVVLDARDLVARVGEAEEALRALGARTSGSVSKRTSRPL